MAVPSVIKACRLASSDEASSARTIVSKALEFTKTCSQDSVQVEQNGRFRS